MKRFALVHFKPLGIQRVWVANEETLTDLLVKFSELVGEECKHVDSYAHQLKDSTLYQIVEVEL